ncbi:hypothetical protein Pmgp_02983 [Pelotomaculum propionicicum]|uniref:Uncharacterized protein n=1 Tax=Pelotomaculum propionicicum TaxID=258475 RepID=A0A4Y7RKV2_9FIRM|nr:hypothetical protein Pmgp_02983 [Pelotomaculum propionicicum]
MHYLLPLFFTSISSRARRKTLIYQGFPWTQKTYFYTRTHVPDTQNPPFARTCGFDSHLRHHTSNIKAFGARCATWPFVFIPLGQHNKFRGVEYRVIYYIDEEGRLIVIAIVGTRENIYDELARRLKW